MCYKDLEKENEGSKKKPPRLGKTYHQSTLQFSEKPFWKSLVGKFEAVFDQEIRIIIKGKLYHREENLDRESEKEKTNVDVLIDRR
jgi:hypothetical protein